MTVQSKPSEKQDKKPPAKQEPPQSPGERLTNYLKGVAAEWHKISWPTMPQIWGQTIVVLVMVFIMTMGLYLLDNAFRLIIGLLPGTSAGS